MFVSLVPRVGALLAQHGAAIAAGVLSGAVVGGAGVATGIVPVGGSQQAPGNVAVLACPGSGSVLTRISSGQTLLITARSADGQWLQVYVGEPGVGRGWAPASALKAQSAVDTLPVADCGATALGPPPTTTPGGTLEPSASVAATVLASPSSVAPSAAPSAKPSAKPTPTPKPHKYFARACGNFDGAGGCTPGGADAMISELIDTNDSGLPDTGDTVKLYRYPTTFADSAAAWGTFGGSTSIRVTSVVLASDHIKVGGADGHGYGWGQNADYEYFGVFASVTSGADVYWEAVDAFTGANSDSIDAASGNPLGVPPMYVDRAGGAHDHFITITSRFSDSTAPNLTNLKTSGEPLNSDPSYGTWQIWRPSATCTPHSATISVTATDPDDAVASIELYYMPYGSTEELSAPMVKKSSTLWQYVINAQDSWLSGQITYRVSARDTHGNSTDLSYDQELYNLYTADC